MKDLLGEEISKHDVVAYANNGGWLALAYVIEVDPDADVIHVLKRGYRDQPKEKVLVRPFDVLVVSEQVDLVDPDEAGRPDEVRFVNKLTNEKLLRPMLESINRE
jgi:hypothetical protein